MSPIPKFATTCGSLDANFGIEGDISNSMIQCGLGFEVPMTNFRNTDRNFKSTALP
jgi:hypothetical protein